MTRNFWGSPSKGWPEFEKEEKPAARKTVRVCSECGSKHVVSAQFPGDVECLDCYTVQSPARILVEEERSVEQMERNGLDGY